MSTSSILSDTFKIDFDKSYGFKIVFAPTVYELLRRFSQVLEQNGVNISMAMRNGDPKNRQDSDDEFEAEEVKGGDLGNASLGFGARSRLTIGGQQSGIANVD